MAFDFSKLNVFTRMDARARILVLLGGLVAFIAVIYVATRYFGGSTKTVGPSSVANAPQGLQSVPGGKLTPEYYRALMQANQQAAQQAKISGGSAVPTLVNIGEPTATATTANCIICSDDNVKVNTLLDEWVKQGKVSPEVASMLEQLAAQNVSVDEYAAKLAELVKEGKLTPEQARQLLEQYKKQHANALLQDSAKTMDDLIKSGQLPIDVANHLLELQKSGITPDQYAAELQRLVAEGKISPEVAKQLLAQYTKQQADEATKKNLAVIDQMARNGEITPTVAKALSDLAKRNVPADQYAAELQRMVAAGQLTPAAAAKLLAAYTQQKGCLQAGPASAGLKATGQRAADKLKADLSGIADTKIAQQLRDLANKNITPEEYAAAANGIAAQGKITPDIAKTIAADYKTVRGLAALQAKLPGLCANNASAAQYADALKQAVAAGLISPEQAQQLLQEYQAQQAAASAAPAGGPAATAGFAALQQAAATGPEEPVTTFTAEQTKAEIESEDDRLARIAALQNAMNSQAQQLINSWQPPIQQYRGGSVDIIRKGGPGGAVVEKGGPGSGKGLVGSNAPIIKSGSILFAVLDTGVNSDYPDSPVLVTIVSGKYKGAKLLGKLQTTKSVAGQMDRIMLTFTLMNMEEWPTSKAITAYAIDPDTARSVLASDVNYHYLKRYGAVMATSLIQGYANAIQSSGATTTTGIFGTSTTHPQLNPSQKLMTAIGQIGTNLGSMTQNWTNIPPTVTVDAGVSLGILFMSDVTG